jgi:hypothetical protein
VARTASSAHGILVSGSRTATHTLLICSSFVRPTAYREFRLRRALLAPVIALALLAAGAGSAAAQQPVAAAPQVIDGPSADIVRPSGLGISIARDGTGGLVYLKQVAGVPHVFVSELTGGTFQAPVQVDQGLGASSQPVIAAGSGGLLLIAFISGGTLYVADRTSGSSALAGPSALVAGASSPAISIANTGKAYLAFTAANAQGGDDVRVAYFNTTSWVVAPIALSVSGTDGAGTGAGRPAVAAAGDGVGIVAWGEAGHILARKTWGTNVSVATEHADAALPGCSLLSADQPAVGTEGNSSFADIAFRELLSCGSGGSQQSRVVMNRLRGSLPLGVVPVDGLSTSSQEGAADPQITMGEYGHGWITSSGTSSNGLFATALGDDGAVWGFTGVNSAAELAAPDGVPATAGLFSNLITWQQTPGSAAQPEIRMRYAPAGGTLGPEIVLSSPALGPTDADNGLAGGGDVAGDCAVAWLQGAPGATQVVAAQLYQAPAPFGPIGPPRYQRLSKPPLSWSQSSEPWGPITYTVTLDGNQIARTTATSVVVPSVLPDGPHTFFVTASNPVGQTAQTRTATVFVDTIPPVAQITLQGAALGTATLVGHALDTFLTYSDLPPPGDPATDASGVASAVINWGDTTSTQLHPGWHRSFHTYTAPGIYTITAVVTDRAGNVGRATLTVTILKPKPKPKKPRPKVHHRRRA